MADKRCPFCGSPDSFVESATLSSAYVVCNGCGARGPEMVQESDEEETPGEENARAAWNTRPISAEELSRACLDVSDWMHRCEENNVSLEPYSAVVIVGRALGIEVEDG